MGTIAKFSIVDRRLFQSLDADRISDAASSPMRQTTVMILMSETPSVANMLVAEDVALRTFSALAALIVLVALMVLVALIVLIALLTVLNIDDNIFPSSNESSISTSSEYK